jgi:hypothetical protein
MHHDSRWRRYWWISELKQHTAIGWLGEKSIHMWRWTDHFLHKPRQNIDNEVYYVCIEFPDLILSTMGFLDDNIFSAYIQLSSTGDVIDMI